MFRVLREAGPLMRAPEFETKCVEAGLKRPTFWSNVRSSPIIRRFAPGLYGLVGADVLPSDIEKKARGRRKRLLQDYSWTNEGGLRITYRLSSSALKNGVLGLPSAVADFFSEEFRLLNEKGGVIGTIKAVAKIFGDFQGSFVEGAPTRVTTC